MRRFFVALIIIAAIVIAIMIATKKTQPDKSNPPDLTRLENAGLGAQEAKYYKVIDE